MRNRMVDHALQVLEGEPRRRLVRRLALVDMVCGAALLVVGLFCGFTAAGLVKVGEPLGLVGQAVFAAECAMAAYLSGVWLCRAILGLEDPP